MYLGECCYLYTKLVSFHHYSMCRFYVCTWLQWCLFGRFYCEIVCFTCSVLPGRLEARIICFLVCLVHGLVGWLVGWLIGWLKLFSRLFRFARLFIFCIPVNIFGLFCSVASHYSSVVFLFASSCCGCVLLHHCTVHLFPGTQKILRPTSATVGPCTAVHGPTVADISLKAFCWLGSYLLTSLGMFLWYMSGYLWHQ